MLILANGKHTTASKHCNATSGAAADIKISIGKEVKKHEFVVTERSGNINVNWLFKTKSVEAAPRDASTVSEKKHRLITQTLKRQLMRMSHIFA